MKTCPILFPLILLFKLLSHTTTSAFTSSTRRALNISTLTDRDRHQHQHQHQHQPLLSSSSSSSSLTFPSSILKIRGGGDVLATNTKSIALYSMMSPCLSAVSSALASGPWGVLALSGVATSVVLPLTMIRQGYSFSVGYGLSVFAMGLALTNTFNIDVITSMPMMSPLSLLASAVMFYGARLGLFLFLREKTVPSKAKQVKEFDKSPRLQRIPLALGVSVFYAFMTSPLMYAARAWPLEDNSMHMIIMNVGVVLTWLGALVEAIADGQKYLAKRSNSKKGDDSDSDVFVGPTSGVYRLCRHPNYFGELLYWFGLTVAGAPSFGTNPIAWTCAGLGLYGIFGIMTGATKRLDVKQKERYEGQKDYNDYVNEVSAPLWPMLK